MPRMHARQRPGQQPGMGQKPEESAFSASSNEYKSLNSSLLVLSQKMNYVIRNEKILGRNLLVLNKKFKGLEEKQAAGGNGAMGGADAVKLQQLISELSEETSRNSEKLMELEALFEQLKDSLASKEELKEIKFIVESINPMELMNLKSAEKFIEKKIEEKLAKKK